MSREELIRYIANEYGISPEFLWEDDKITCVFRHLGSKKWFGILMKIPGSKIGLKTNAIIDIMNVKLEPDFVREITTTKSSQVFPAWHMNKKHWVSVLLSSDNDQALTQSLIHESFRLTN